MAKHTHHKAKDAIMSLYAFATTTSQDLPVFVEEPVCNEPDVVFQGNMHEVDHVTVSDGLNVNLSTEHNWLGVVGTVVAGPDAGATYHTVDVFDYSFGLGLLTDRMTTTTTDTVHYVSSNPDLQDFYMHTNLHTTVNSNGVTTSSVDNAYVDCK